MLFGPQLTPDERMEIESYPEIYFLGQDAKIKVNGRDNQHCEENCNNDQNGNFIKVTEG